MFRKQYLGQNPESLKEEKLAEGKSTNLGKFRDETT
jgi:hypothetical protein